MIGLQKIAVLICFVGMALGASAQNAKFDKLEMLFDQGHYKKVYRMSNHLLDNPEYDFSLLPKYYKSLSLLQLSQNSYWLKRHPEALTTARDLFLEVKKSPGSEDLFNAHMYELNWLKNDMISWANDQQYMGKKENFELAQEIIDLLFEEVEEIDTRPSDVAVEDLDTVPIVGDLSLRDEIVQTAKKQIGVPYVWAGTTPDGFDCSGFTSYVMSLNGSQLPRRASDQYKSARKVKAKHVQKGDLVFFDNGSGVSHVGIVVSNPGEPLTMIHSSSSKGIIITDITKSEYWSKRLKGFATYVER